MLVVLGVLLLLGSVASFVVGLVVAGREVVETAGDLVDFRADLAVEVDQPGSAQVRLDRDTRYAVWAMGPSLVQTVIGDVGGSDRTDVAAFREPEVTVTGPDGEAVRLRPPGLDATVDLPGGDAVAVAEFRSGAAGTYTVTVAGDDPSVRSVGIGTTLAFTDSVEAIIGSAVAIVLAAVLGPLGLVLVVVGIIWGASRRRVPGPPPPPPPSPWGTSPWGTPGPGTPGWGTPGAGTAPWGAPGGAPPTWGPPPSPPSPPGGAPPTWGGPVR